MSYDDLLLRFVQMSKDVLGENLVGIYLHGSAAMGCFHPQKSDLDLLVVVKEDISDAQKMHFMNEVVLLNREAPAKGLELSILKKKFCKPFVYPTPFELHFSITHLHWFLENPNDYIKKMKGTDKDLAAHIVITRRYGKVLYGDAIDSIFGEVGKKEYIDSIWLDVESAREDILSNPMYVILNLCRVLAYLQEDLVLSKKSGGEWAVHVLPQEFQSFVQMALNSYCSEDEMKVDSKIADSEIVELALHFADFMLLEIEKWKDTVISSK